MKKKTTRRAAGKLSQAVQRPLLFRTVVRGLIKLFSEELPVTEFQGTGKFDTPVEKVSLYQNALEIICGGRTSQKQKLTTVALLTPQKVDETIQVTIDGHCVGRLKKADAKFLKKQLDTAEFEPCAVRVAAQIRDGRRKKNGAVEDFTVVLCLPQRPARPKAASAQ